MDRPEVVDNLQQVRREELDRAAAIIGYDVVHMLGYRDSGMPDSDANFHPDCFAVAPHDEAVDRLVAILRAEHPQVVVTYPEDQGNYQHPDHLRVWDITLPAVERARDASYRPELGAAWSVSKIYYTMWSRARILARHQAFLISGSSRPTTTAGSNVPTRTTRSPPESRSMASPTSAVMGCSLTQPRSIRRRVLVRTS